MDANYSGVPLLLTGFNGTAVWVNKTDKLVKRGGLSLSRSFYVKNMDLQINSTQPEAMPRCYIFNTLLLCYGLYLCSYVVSIER